MNNETTVPGGFAAGILPPFDRTAVSIKRSLAHILEHAPVLNLTHQEVLSTLRIIRLQAALADRQYQYIYIHNDDERLKYCDDTDRFLALLLECDQRNRLLGTKRCRLRFGGSAYHWRKIARECEIVTTVSVSDGFAAETTVFHGRGWTLAPNIVTLRKWIVATTQNPDIKRIKL